MSVFSERLFFFAHRLMAGVSSDDPRPLLDLVLQPNLNPLTRATGVSAISLQGGYGDIARGDAVRLMRETFKLVRALKEQWTACCWARTTAKLHGSRRTPEQACQALGFDATALLELLNTLDLAT